MTFTTQQHWKFFAEFCTYELRAGGPDPHMKLVGQMSKNDEASAAETAWRGLCYCAVYNVPTAAVLWVHWPQERVLADGPTALEVWLRNHWKGIAFRRERKAVRRPDWLSKCLYSAAEWASKLPEKRATEFGWFAKELDPSARFELAYDDACSVYGFGRYIGQKYVEYGRRYLGWPAQVQDIRPKGGWSPRASLALLFPQHATVLNGGDGKEEVAVAIDCSLHAKNRLAQEFGVDVDWYLLQVLLCDYKQSVVGRRQFPGKSQDSELEYDNKLAPFWGKCEGMYRARRELFPHQVLGELNGWNHVRKELGYVLHDYGYTWTDFHYDYNATTQLQTPTLRKL